MEKIYYDRLVELVLANSIGSNKLQLKEETDLIKDLSFSSITTIKLIVDIEREFDINFPDEELLLEKIRTFSSLKNIVSNCINQKHE